MSDPDPLDRPALDELRSILRDDGLAELIDLYLAEAPRMLDAVAEAHGAGDAARLRTAAHRLKGAAAGIGARAVERAARALEHEAHAGRVPDARAVDALREAAATCAAALGGFLPEG